MSTQNHTMTKSTLNRLTTGFVTSVVLTVGAYLLVTNHAVNGWGMFILLGVLAFVQCIVQLIFFLGLTDSDGPRWKLGVFLFMLMVLLLVILGSLWIMHSLNYRMMTPEQMNSYMQNQDNSGF